MVQKRVMSFHSPIIPIQISAALSGPIMRIGLRRDVLTATFNLVCSYRTATAVIYSQAGSH